MNELEQFKTVHGVSWSLLDTGGNSMEPKTTAIRAIKEEVDRSKILTPIPLLESGFLDGLEDCGIHSLFFSFHVKLMSNGTEHTVIYRNVLYQRELDQRNLSWYLRQAAP